MSNKIFMLYHLDQDKDTKLIGYFLDYQNIEEALRHLKQQPGFCDYQEGFAIQEFELDKVYWPEYSHPVYYSL